MACPFARADAWAAPASVAAAAGAAVCWYCRRGGREGASSRRRREARELAVRLQDRLRERLTTFSAAAARGGTPGDRGAGFERTVWRRNGGRWGGGYRWSLRDTHAFSRASLNFSFVQYDDSPEKPLGSATALSCIIHPAHPRAPSVHMHISWTEMKKKEGEEKGTAHWRVMADLNPSIPSTADTERFRTALQCAAGEHYKAAAANGDRYFSIPALGRTRGVTHFYLEAFATQDPSADVKLAESIGIAVIDTYASIITDAAAPAPPEPAVPAPTADEREKQLRYHTLYLFQVLTLDRGTTSGMLAHAENDLGITGSLPAVVKPSLLQEWRGKVDEIQRPLVDALIAALPESGAVDDATKLKLAQSLRQFYKENRGALQHQARGNVLPPGTGGVSHGGGAAPAPQR